MTNILQGYTANLNGKTLENNVEAIILAQGFSLINYSIYIKALESKVQLGSELLIKNFPFTTLYNHKGKTEFLLKSIRLPKAMRIECKYQIVAGSVDEKLPYLFLNAVNCMPEEIIIIVIDGPGFKKGAVQWLKNAAKTVATKQILVFSLIEFELWFQNVFIKPPA